MTKLLDTLLAKEPVCYLTKTLPNLSCVIVIILLLYYCYQPLDFRSNNCNVEMINTIATACLSCFA